MKYLCYVSFIRPILEYGVVWDGCAQTDEKLLEDLQLAAARIVPGAMRTTSSAKLYEETALPNIPIPKDNFRPNTRGRSDLRKRSELPSFKSSYPEQYYLRNPFFPSATTLWNLIPFKNSILYRIPSNIPNSLI